MSPESGNAENREGAAGYQPKINEVAKNFLEDLQKERSRLAEDFPLCNLLIDEGNLILQKSLRDVCNK